MATDRPGDYIGNHGGKYTDESGMTRQFTYVDHDKKPTISTNTEKVDKSWQKEYRNSIINRILGIPASLCPEPYYDFTVRGENQNTITWNEKMVRDEGIEIDRLRMLCTLLENKADMMKIIY